MITSQLIETLLYSTWKGQNIDGNRHLEFTQTTTCEAIIIIQKEKQKSNFGKLSRSLNSGQCSGKYTTHMVSFSYKMKLLNAISPLVISKRFSRNSVIQYRRRRSLLKDYQIVKPSEENVYARLQAPLAEIVPVNEKKTSITIDILGEEGYNQLSEWRRNNLVRRARRVLPLPISLTTDDQVGQVWKQRFGRNSRRKEANLTEKLWNQIPNFVHYLMEKDAEMFRQQFPELYSQYQELMRYASDPNKKQIVDPKVYFPFLNALEKIDPKDFESLQEADESVESKVLDQEYENYLKHHNLLQYFASTLNTIHASEYEPEIEGWTSQFWLRSGFNCLVSALIV